MDEFLQLVGSFESELETQKQVIKDFESRTYVCSKTEMAHDAMEAEHVLAASNKTLKDISLSMSTTLNACADQHTKQIFRSHINRLKRPLAEVEANWLCVKQKVEKRYDDLYITKRTGHRSAVSPINAPLVQLTSSERSNAIQKIEKDMIELSGLFRNLENMVEKQDVPISEIEQQTSEAVEIAEAANENLGHAEDDLRKLRQKRKLLYLIWTSIAIVALVFLVIIALIFRPKAT